MQTISPTKLSEISERHEIELLDVRTQVEFREVHATMAQNVPLDSLNPADVMRQRTGNANQPLYVICLSGGRSMKACEAFVAAGFQNVVSVDGGTLAWDSAGLAVKRGLKTVSFERQVRITAGTIALAGSVVVMVTGNVAFAGIPAFIGAGLAFAGITDTCGMGMMLAKMPWNQCESPHTESCAT
ncbi:MAG: rhodanese-like domain-containing protein [Fuerstiella sp.]